MAAQNHYEITVSLSGVRHFSTAMPSDTLHVEARELFLMLQAKFPETSGYKVECVHWFCESEAVEF